MARVELRLLGELKGLLPGECRGEGSIELVAPDGATLRDLLVTAGVAEGDTLAVLVNGRQAAWDAVPAGGDVIAVFPAVTRG